MIKKTRSFRDQHASPIEIERLTGPTAPKLNVLQPPNTNNFMNTLGSAVSKNEKDEDSFESAKDSLAIEINGSQKTHRSGLTHGINSKISSRFSMLFEGSKQYKITILPVNSHNEDNSSLSEDKDTFTESQADSVTNELSDDFMNNPSIGKLQIPNIFIIDDDFIRQTDSLNPDNMFYIGIISTIIFIDHLRGMKANKTKRSTLNIPLSEFSLEQLVNPLNQAKRFNTGKNQLPQK